MTEISSNFLDEILKPEDVRNLNYNESDALAGEIRSILIESISNNGGHLASNLGVVELTIALLRNFNFETDRIVWDVGHQTYAYKILTGRRNRFDGIRKKNGISGFPKRDESIFDHFNTGHSSTAVSAALGYARAAAIRGEKRYSLAVVGDGAMTGGMAFEALNDAGASGENVIVVLNDNEMSITKNVGGIAEYFSRMRSSRLYSGTNESVKKRIEKIPGLGKLISRLVHRTKSAVKYLFSQNMLFEEMGFQYLGPVYGHDIKKLDKIFKDAKKIKGPVLVHAVTTKGKGYEKAERKPELYHGVGKFDVLNGLDGTIKESFSHAYGKLLLDIASDDESISVICPAVTLGCGLMELPDRIPGRFFDVGIAEQHAVTLAAGMACGGLKPIVAGYSTFMQRAYDQMLHDVCLMNLHVVFTFDRAGVVGSDGHTHQGVYDLSYLSNMPNIKIFAPYDNSSLGDLLKHALYDEKGPVVIRYPKGKISIPIIKDERLPGKLKVLKNGSDCIIFSYGRMLETAFEISDLLKEKGMECAVADLGCLKPLDNKGIIESIKSKKAAFCIEDVVESGSCSEKISYLFSKQKELISFRGFTLGETFTAEGGIDEILEANGLDAGTIASDVLEFLI